MNDVLRDSLTISKDDQKRVESIFNRLLQNDSETSIFRFYSTYSSKYALFINCTM